MPTASIGLFDSFDNLDQISPEAVSSWLRPVPQLTQIENFLANKILYPQTLPLTQQDMQIDLAVFREALKMNTPAKDQQQNILLGDSPFLNITLRKILIPAKFLQFVPDLATLTTAFIDAFLLNRTKEDWFQDIWTVVLTNVSDEVVGSVVLPQFEDRKGQMQLSLQGKSYEIHQGDLMVLPCLKDRCEIGYSLQKGKILGRSESAVEIYGGSLGLVIDGRNI